MTPKLNTRPKSSLWLLFSLLIATSFSIEAASAKRGITIDDLSAMRHIKSKALSPNGKYIAFQLIQGHKNTNDYTVDWYVAATKPGAKPIKIARGTQPLLNSNGHFDSSDIIWSPDSEWIYFTKKHEGAVQIWRSSRSKPQQQQVTHNPADVQNLTSLHYSGDFQALHMSPDGSKVFFTVGRIRAELKTLKRKLSEQGFLQQEPRSYTYRFDPLIPPCTVGQEHMTKLQLQKHGCRLTHWVYDITSDIERKATKVEINSLPGKRKDDRAFASELKEMKRSSPGGAKLAWLENIDPEIYKGYFPQMILKVSKNGEDIICPAKECINQFKVGFRGVWWHPNGKEIIFHVIDGPHNSLNSFYSWTPGEAKVRTILRTDDYFGIGYYGQLCDLTGKRLICTRSTWTSPTEIASINLDNGKISTIVNINPEFKNFSFTKIEKILGEDNYGHKVYANLVYPKGYKKGQRYPLVITGYNSYGFLGVEGVAEQPVHVYAQKGIAVLSYDYGGRHSERQQKLRGEHNIRAFYQDSFIKQSTLTAIEKMVEGLVDRGIIDPKRVGISGLSHGSVILTNALLRKNYAAASTSELFSIPTFYGHSATSSYGKLLDDTFGKVSTAEGQKMRRKYSLAANAQRINTPLLSQVSDQESHYGENDYNALLDAGKPIEMYVYPNAYHIKWQPAHNYIVYKRNLDWFSFWLRGVEDKDAEKAEQYQRWHKLRDLHLANLAKLHKRYVIRD